MSKPIIAKNLKGCSDNPFPQVFHSKMGDSVWRGLSDEFKLSHFGVNMEVILPGGSSGLKHWHTHSEEFVYVLSGELVLVYGDEEHTLIAGSCMGFKANEGIGHRIVNRSNTDASFLVVGSRHEADKAHYDEDDMQWLVKEDGEWLAAKKDGQTY
jgi:uncharacterized cupin superfamily protein